MHILIVGGSGRSGQLIVDKALSKGHHVTALVRRAPSLAQRPNLSIVEGTPLSGPDLDRAFTAGTGNDKGASSAPDAVAVALNARRTSDSPFAAQSPDTPPRLLANSVANTVACMKRHGVAKIVILSSMATGSAFYGMNCLMRLLFTKTNLRYQWEDHNALDAETRKAGVDFVFARAVILTDGPEAKVKVYPEDGKGCGMLAKISRASVADFMVRALETTEYDGQSPVITN